MRHHHARSMGRQAITKILLVLLSLIVLQCAGGDEESFDAFYLNIKSQQVAEPITSLAVLFKSADTIVAPESKGGDATTSVTIPSGLDIRIEPFVLKLAGGSSGSLKGKVLISIHGLSSDGVVQSLFVETVDVGTKGELDIMLEAIGTDCDVDGDGFVDCSKSNCCVGGSATVVGDCDDTNATINPMSEIIQCRTCDDTDDDGVNDCTEFTSGDCPEDALDDPTMYPGALESCDGIDNNCNGQVDEGIYYVPKNADAIPLGDPCGIGACEGGTVVCAADGSAVCSSDGNAVPETCDGIDNNCNGQIDEGSGCLDDDIDGDGDIDSEDCNPYDSSFFHGAYEPCCSRDLQGDDAAAVEQCDKNCDGQVEFCAEDDLDNDGFGSDEDCDDNDPTVYPGAPEKCADSIDQDCNGEDLACAGLTDADGDGFSTETDCDDTKYEVNPHASESCNNIDDNCDGIVDEGNGGIEAEDCGTDEGECTMGTRACVHNYDTDGDGEPDLEVGEVCAGEVEGAETDNLCDGLDNDCDGYTDEDYTYEGDFVGEDCDGVGACGIGSIVCSDDGLSAVCSTNPDGPNNQSTEETCNNVDDDCDGTTDEELYGAALSDCADIGVCAGQEDSIQAICIEGTWQCDYSQIAGYETTELHCDGLDNDCDGSTDEDLQYIDWDASVKYIGETCGTGPCADGTLVCADDTLGLTCSSDTLIEDEICDGIDNDCDGDIDEELLYNGLALGEVCDGVGECGLGVVECDSATHETTCSTNLNGSEYAGTVELCDYKDNDCNGETDDGVELDGQPLGGSCPGLGECSDGVVECNTVTKLAVCSTSLDGSQYDGVAELCDALDNDCDGSTDEELAYDGNLLGEECDGVGECGGGTVECNLSTKATTCSTNPGGSEDSSSQELCDGLDNDCDGQEDEGIFYKGDAVGEPCNGVGSCGVGVVECNVDLVATCSTNPDGTDSESIPESCNSLDDDCDGYTDEELTIADSNCKLVGVCSETNVDGTCFNGTWLCDYSAINLYSGNAEDMCDGFDNDCDGETDEEFFITDYDGSSKYIGEACGTGTCVGGAVICNEINPMEAICSTDLSDFEVCDGIDNDCDGQTDEGLMWQGIPLGDQCDGTGECGQGDVVCSATTLKATCSTNPNGPYSEAVSEICDSLDNDCDGDVDEELQYQGAPLGGQCNGIGECGIGIVVCSPTDQKTTCSTNPNGTDPQVEAESCNGLDDDCDTLTDEDLGIDDSDCLVIGVCNPQLVNAECTDGSWVCDYSSISDYNEGDEVGFCDSLDNDCDGSTDEDYVSLTPDLEPSLGAECDGIDADLCATGTWTCTSTHDDLECINEAEAFDELCSTVGVDDDCNGQTDEEGAADCTIYYKDADSDTFGLDDDTRCLCSPLGYYITETPGDCNDLDNKIKPNATEVCDDIDNNCSSETDEGCDDDDDNFCDITMGIVGTPSTCTAGGQDCDDDDAVVNPAAIENCLTDYDDNCNGQTNEQDALSCTTYYWDEDSDDYGTENYTPRCYCSPKDVFTATESGDCNDVNNQINPGMNELCSTATTDDDCSGSTNDPGAIGCQNYYVDADGDGHGTGEPLCLCKAAAPNVVLTSDDCNDDAASDGALMFPGNVEICDTIDNDCNGQTDEGDLNPVSSGCTVYHRDADSDGFGDASDSQCLCAPDTLNHYTCNPLDGCATTDCNDSVAAINTDAIEVCGDTIDNDCDGTTDQGDFTALLEVGSDTPTDNPTGAPFSCVWFYSDVDEDGYGNETDFACRCAALSPYDTDTTGDCNDLNDAINPDALESCDGVDQDCDGTTDEGCDLDGDGYCGTSVIVVDNSMCPNSTIGDPGNDCDDDNIDVHPGATEVCNGLDDDCNGFTDSDATGGGYVEDISGCVNYYRDLDSDGYMNDTDFICLCEANVNAKYTCRDDVADPEYCPPGDCADSNANINPDATDTCLTAGVDDNCDGVTDVEGSVTDCTTYYYDGDGDSYGVVNGPHPSRCLCGPDAAGDYDVTNTDDCNDALASVSPDGTETCNTADDDCDGQTDEGNDLTGCTDYYPDSDGDSYGAIGSTPTCTCSLHQPANTSTNQLDCNDSDDSISPDAIEKCTGGKDENCDGVTDDFPTAPGGDIALSGCTNYYLDTDNDGHGDPSSAFCLCPATASNHPTYENITPDDCNDGNALVYTGAGEQCSNIDNDCDGTTDEGCDDDNDNYCQSGMTVTNNTVCPLTSLGTGDDCNDNVSAIHPGVTEICDNVDNNCTSGTDEGCDNDSDGYCDTSMTVTAAGVSGTCPNTTITSGHGDDCLDNDANVHPSATEICSNKDDNCNGSTDEGCDNDNDNYCDSSMYVENNATCTGSSNGSFGNDCNDTQSSIHPGATEICDGVNQDCDGFTDEGVGADAYENNDTAATRYDLGITLHVDTNDSWQLTNGSNGNATLHLDGSGNTDKDWYKYYCDDDNYSDDPEPGAKLLSPPINFNVCVTFDCSDGSNPSFSCKVGTAATLPNGMSGCCGVNQAQLNSFECDSTYEHGDTLIYVYPSNSDHSCTSFDMKFICDGDV